MRSAEEQIIRSVIEDDKGYAAVLLTDWLDGELVEFHGSLSQAMDLVLAEARARGLRT